MANKNNNTLKNIHSNKKENLAEIEIARVLAALSVLAIHITSLPLGDLDKTSKSYFVFYIINRILQFAVPLFLIMSGILEAGKLRRHLDTCKNPSKNLTEKPSTGFLYNQPDPNLIKYFIDFFARKIKRVFVPYLLWSMFYIFINVILVRGYRTHILETGTLKFLANSLLFGKAYYHLYFMSILLQYFIAFPLFFLLIHSADKLFRYLSFKSIRHKSSYNRNNIIKDNFDNKNNITQSKLIKKRNTISKQNKLILHNNAQKTYAGGSKNPFQGIFILGILIVAYLLQLLFYYKIGTHFYQYFNEIVITLPWYFFITFSATVLGYYYDEIKQNAANWLILSSATTIISGVIYIRETLAIEFLQQTATNYYLPNWYIFTFFASVTIMLSGTKIHSYLLGKGEGCTSLFMRTIYAISTHSLGIYLLHPLLISIYNKFRAFAPQTGVIVYCIQLAIVSVVILIISMAVDRAIAKNKCTAWLIGR